MIDCKLLKNCSLIRIKSSGLKGNVRKVPVTRDAAEKLVGPSVLVMTEEEREKQIDDALKTLKASTKLITCPELQAIAGFQAEFKQRMLSQYCNPSFIDEGLYSVRTSLAFEVAKEFKEAQGAIGLLAEKFGEVYGKRVVEAATIWGEKAIAGLPSKDAMVQQFKIEYRMTQLDVPEGLPPEIREEEERKLRESYAVAEKAIVGALWAEFSAMLADVTAKLEVKEDGKKKVFRDTLFEDITAFVASFSNRNVFDDQRLRDLVTQANALIAKVGGKDTAEAAQRMRDFEGLRDQTRNAFVALTAETAKAIDEDATRKFTFDE